jgi:hypothetical protein
MRGMLRPRIRRLFRLAIRRPDRTESDVDAELRLHLELRIEQLVASGWTRSDAEVEARRRFGPSWDDAMRERVESLWQDVRYTLRGLRRAPRFAATAVLTLALGLGSTTVIVSLVDHIVVRPLPYADADRLVVVREIVGRLRNMYPTMSANASHFLEWKRACTVCEGMAAARSA